MAKAERILDLFPAFYGAKDRTKLLFDVVHNLAQPLDEADTHIFRIQRSHRLQVAEHVEDIIRLAGLFNLTPFHFEDILVDKGIDYDRKLAMMRERVQRIARVHLKGLGTPWAVMEATAIFLNAAIVSRDGDTALIRHIDEEKLSHKAVVRFASRDDDSTERIYLHENPLRRKKRELAGMWPLNSWKIDNHNVQDTSLRLVIQGVEDRTVLPGIFCPDTQKGIVFNGIVPDGGKLIIDELNGALLDNQPVDEWLIYFEGAISDFSYNEDARTVIEQDRGAEPFDGNTEQIVYRPYRKKTKDVTAPPGATVWHFTVAEGVYDGCDNDYSVYATEHLPIGEYDREFTFDQCVYDYPPSAMVGTAWHERVPCAFKVVLPLTINASSSSGEAQQGPHLNHVSRVGNILPRFKAAGIKAYVDTARDAWILGESILNSEQAAGDDAATSTTTLRSYTADLVIN